MFPVVNPIGALRQNNARQYAKTWAALIAFAGVFTSAHAQQSGAVPGNCTIDAAGTTMTCQVTVSLANVAGTFGANSLTINGSIAPSVPTCSATSPASQSVAINAQPTPLNANCINATSYQWYIGSNIATRVPINLATSATYTPPTTDVGSIVYTVTATNTTGTSTSTGSATVNVVQQGSAPTCTGITPTSQSVTQNAVATALTANCSNASSYQWYSGSSYAGRQQIAGATAATYPPPTTATGTLTYWVDAVNTAGTTPITTGASVTVNAAPTGTCPPGEPRVTANFTTSVQNFTYNSIIGTTGVHVTKITVGANDTTIGKNILPSFLITQDDTTTFSTRTVTLSQSCGDFSANARVLIANANGGSSSFVTQNDPRASATVAVMTPGIWYINVRNNDCPAGINCSISGIWRNWNK